jgi:hypothetical protein
MKSNKTIFIIPTYRLRDVAAMAEKHDQHFWTNGHAVKIMVFDDSSVANHEKYYPFSSRPKPSTLVEICYPQKDKRQLPQINKSKADIHAPSQIHRVSRWQFGRRASRPWLAARSHPHILIRR